MIHIEGDLIELFGNSKIDVLVHGCNCFHTMGAGIAKIIKETYPEALKSDKQTRYGDKNKLGTYSFANILVNGNEQYIVNAYTQFNYGRGKDLFSYETFPKLLNSIKEEFGELRIGLPLIGCGLAGGDENRIISMIEAGFDGVNYTIVTLPQNNISPKKIKL